MLEQSNVIQTIEKGFSNDKKFIVQHGDEKFILRLFEGNQKRREQEFQLLQQLEQLGTTSLRAISIEEGKMVTSFIEGSDGEEVIQTLSEEEQYQVGWDASQDLLKIHLIAATENNWAKNQAEKYKRYLNRYEKLSIKVEGDKQIIRFIEERLPLMKGRPSVLQHDDFHLSNIIIRNRKYAGVIDFGRFDWGDSIMDFIKLGLFSSEKSVPFCKGVIEGYFGGKPSKEFWELYGLYLAMNVFSAIVWGQQNGNLEELSKHVDRFIQDHKGFTQIVPAWYNR